MSLIASLPLCALSVVQAAPAAKASAADPALRKMSAPRLVQEIYAHRGQAQRDVMDELVRRGPEADRPLLEDMGRHNATIQMIFAQKGAPAIPRLIPLLDDPKLTHAAGNALVQASSHKAKAQLPALLKCLKDHPELQYCGMALGKSAGREAASFAPKLAKELSHKKPLVRMFAATALGEIGPAAGLAAVTALAQRLEDKEPGVAWAAAAALGKMGPAAKPAAGALEKAAASADHELQTQALEALKKVRG